jgi:hypothetical protein
MELHMRLCCIGKNRLHRMRNSNWNRTQSVMLANGFVVVKQLGYQDIAHGNPPGNPPLNFDCCRELLFSSYSTYDKNYATPMKQSFIVYKL